MSRASITRQTLAAMQTSGYDLRNSFKPQLLLEQARMAKGGVIGTNGKPVIALRFDDGQDAFRTTVYPLLTARGLPCSHALISEFSSQSWGSGTTWADVLDWYKNGVEIWCHGKDHKDYQGFSGLYANIVTAKETIEAQGIKVQGWALPGVTPVYNTAPYNTLNSIDDYESETGRLLMNNYALTEAYAGGKNRFLPNGRYHGLDHVTVSDGISLVDAQGIVDVCIKEKLGRELMIHPANLGKAGMLSIADFTTLLDYIVAKWEAGDIEVLTPSGLCFADSTTAQRLDLIKDGSFEGITVESAGDWSNTSVWTGKTIETSGGRTGANYLSIASDAGAQFVIHREMNIVTRGLDGETFVFEGWFRSNGVSNTVARVVVQSYPTTTLLNLNKTKVSNGAEWTRLRFAFSIPPTVDQLSIGLQRNSGDGIDWDDISVKKV